MFYLSLSFFSFIINYDCFQSPNKKVSEVGTHALIKWLQEDKTRQNTLLRNPFFVSAPYILSVPVERNREEEEKNQVENKIRLFQLYLSLINRKISLPFAGEVLNEAQKIIEDFNKREESSDEELENIWSELHDVASLYSTYSIRSGIKRMISANKEDYELIREQVKKECQEEFAKQTKQTLPNPPEKQMDDRHLNSL